MDGQTYSAIVDATVWTVNDLTAGNPSGNSPQEGSISLEIDNFTRGPWLMRLMVLQKSSINQILH